MSVFLLAVSTRSLSEELKKEVEELRAAKLALERRVEEGQQSASAAASSDSDTVNELKQQVEKLTQVSGQVYYSNILL